MATVAKLQLQKGQRVAKWLVDEKLGSGSFGDVYQVQNSSGATFAMKTEKVDEAASILKIEVHVMSNLYRLNSKHFCKIEDSGTFSNFRYIVMTLVGPSLQDLRRRFPEDKQKFSMGCALSIGIKCIEAIEELHSLVGILHRDIKPGNFAIGASDKRQIYLIDFGMARCFLGPDGRVLPPRLSAGFRGTLRYASISCHIARELCRKDDLESWLYMQIELTRGRINELFGGCPQEYVDAIRYLDTLRYYDKPDYEKVVGMMKKAISSNNLKEFPYDWEVPKSS
uniref:Protein kinase domain-containing protein n=1 Tax=Ditylenchus dipsaci TaxID=166011 RepID=A0A915ECC0_9BILA